METASEAESGWLRLVRETLEARTEWDQRYPYPEQPLGDHVASFSVEPAGEPWIQAHEHWLNFFYPHADHPDSRVLPILASAHVQPLTLVEWLSGRFATYTLPTTATLVEQARLIDQLLTEFYCLPTSCRLTAGVFRCN